MYWTGTLHDVCSDWCIGLDWCVACSRMYVLDCCRVSSPETRKDFYIIMNRSEHTDTVQNTCT